MQLRCSLAGPIVAQVVAIHTVNHVRNAPLPRDLVEAREQLVLAVEAAVGIVGDVVGIIELVRFNVFVTDAVVAGKLFRVALVGLRKRRRIRGNRDGVIAQRLLRRPGKIGGIRAAGIGDDHAAHVPERVD